MIEILLNGSPKSIESNCTVGSLLAILEISVRGSAIAINGEVIPKSIWEVHEIKDNDRVELLTIAQGG